MRRCLLLLGSLLALTAAAETVLSGRTWQATIGEDGLLRSYRVGDVEFLRPFADRPAAMLVQRDEKDLPFVQVRTTETGGLAARNDVFALEYVPQEDALLLRAESLVVGTVITLRWRPSEAVVRALDSEDDTAVDPRKTWYDDMIAARWLTAAGPLLTFRQLAGYWTRVPYTNEGAPCLGTTLYPRQKLEFALAGEATPGPLSALAFEVRGENPDFLPPGGRPALFPCVAENVGAAPLALAYAVTVTQYADGGEVLRLAGEFTLAAAMTATVPLELPLRDPGVYRATLALSHGRQVLKTKHWNFCYAFGDWYPACPRPVDFDAFWQRALDDLARVPVDLQRTEVARDAQSVLYKVSFAVLDGARGYAWLRLPVVPAGQKVPARLELPPSGANNLPPPAASGFAEMKLAIHGYDVDLSDFPAEQPWPGGRYHVVGLARPETWFYRQVYLRCVRAFDVLTALPETDSRRIMVYGGSQGGGLSIVTAALRPEVAFCAPAIPGLCRLDWTVRHGVGSWPLTQQDVPAGQTLEQMLATLSYYDAANFIGRIKCPIAGTIGWLDTITAAGGQVAAFAQANRERLTFTAAPWGRHGADGRTQQAYYGNHTLFQQGQPIPLPKTWLMPPTDGGR